MKITLSLQIDKDKNKGTEERTPNMTPIPENDAKLPNPVPDFRDGEYL